MRKKYLSALLFGALLFASAGTFTSCKDYDDDISNLQGQIDDVNTAITELQSAVEGGKYVTAVSNTGNTITFTFSDGTTTQVALEDQVGSVVTVQDGVLYIDGEATEIKVAEPAPTPEPGEETKDQIIIENGMWSVLQEDGTTYKSTGIPVSGISVSGSEEEGFTLRVYNNGSEEPQIVKLPSASSSLVDIILVDSKNGMSGSANQYQTITLNNFGQFEYKGVDVTAPQKWPGTKALPANGMHIIAQQSPLLVQINPVEVDGKDVKFDLKDSQNASANLDFTVKDYTSLLTVGSRTANSNGLYELAIDDKALNDNDAKAFLDNFEANNGSDKRYAVTAGSVRSEYNVLCTEGTGKVENLTFDIINSSYVPVKNDINLKGNEEIIDNALLQEGEWYTISADMTQIYDIFVSTDKDSETLYGIECNNENGVYQFRYTKTPDNVSKPRITIKVESVDKKGNYRTNKVTLSLSEVVADAYTYAEKAWTIVDYANDNDYIDKNSFAMKMSDMLNSFSADNLALWNTKVQNFTVQLYDVETGLPAKDSNGNTIKGLPTDMHLVFVDKNNKDLFDVEGAVAASAQTGADKIKATANIELRFENSDALAAALALNHKYQAVITFNGGDTNSMLNTTAIPFTLSIPSINDLFVQQNGVFIGGVANAYMDDEAATTETLAATYPFKSAFNKLPENHTTYSFTLDDKTVITDNKKSSDLAAIDDKKKESTITLTGSTDGNGLQKGYKQELIVNIKNVKFAGVWNYGTADDVDYSFKIKVMSPLYEGKVVAAGDVVEIPASDINGHEVNGSDILGYTYNNIEYSIFPDAGSKDKLDYKRKEVKEVKFASMDNNIFTVPKEDPEGYTPGTDKSPAKNGYVVVMPKNLAETTDSKLEVTLTDAWGYKKVVEIPVRVVVGE